MGRRATHYTGIGSGAERSSVRVLFLAKRIERDHFGARVV